MLHFTDTLSKQKFIELELYTPYIILKAKIVNTKFGEGVLLELEESIA